MVDISKLRDPSPWNPLVNSAIDLKHLGKFGEELNECGGIVSRCIIQGVEGREPVTDKPNREALEDEIADIMANAELNIEHFGLDLQRIKERKVLKKEHLRRWHQMLAK